VCLVLLQRTGLAFVDLSIIWHLGSVLKVHYKGFVLCPSIGLHTVVNGNAFGVLRNACVVQAFILWIIWASIALRVHIGVSLL
jgi:hypothetical protein